MPIPAGGAMGPQSRPQATDLNRVRGSKLYRARRGLFGPSLICVALVARGYGLDPLGFDRLLEWVTEAAATSPTDQRVARLIELGAASEVAGQASDAADHYRRALQLAPRDDAAYEALLRVTKQLELPTTSAAYNAARAVLPPTFIQYETRRFVVLSDAHPSWTRAQADRLERTHHQFLRYANRTELRPLPLRHKLVCVLFDDRDAYRAFAKTHDGVKDLWIAGYYSPHNDRVAFYHGDANPSVVEARARLDELLADVDALDAEVRTAHRQGLLARAEEIRERREAYHAHIVRERERVDSFAAQINVATTVHEAIHQLMFHTGVQSASVQYPLWVSEGLATAFETDRTGGAFGPDHEHEQRREVFEEMLADDRLVPLEKLVSWSEVPSSHRTVVNAMYHQSYALVTWMSRFRRDELREYLLHMRELTPGTLTPRRHLELFEDAFGPVERLERAWLRHERSK